MIDEREMDYDIHIAETYTRLCELREVVAEGARIATELNKGDAALKWQEVDDHLARASGYWD